MAVASFHVGGEQVVLRGFHPPKTASVTHWYRAAVAQIPDAPEWRTVDMGAATVDEDAIVFQGNDWALFIARRRFLKS